MAVNLKEDIKPISYIKSNSAEMLDYINDNKNPIIITQNGDARGVLLDIESYQNMVNALSIMKLLQVSERAIQNKQTKSHAEVFAALEKKIAKQP
jgi:prevent-host-death family protein